MYQCCYYRVPFDSYHHWCCEFRSGRGVQHYVIKFVGDLWQVGGLLRVLRFPPPIKLTATINWNIVESGVKHHKTKANLWLPGSEQFFFIFISLECINDFAIELQLINMDLSSECLPNIEACTFVKGNEVYLI